MPTSGTSKSSSIPHIEAKPAKWNDLFTFRIWLVGIARERELHYKSRANQQQNTHDNKKKYDGEIQIVKHV